MPRWTGNISLSLSFILSMHFLYYLLLYFPCSFFITSTAFSHALPTRLLVDGVGRTIKRPGQLTCIRPLNPGLPGSAGLGILPSLPAKGARVSETAVKFQRLRAQPLIRPRGLGNNNPRTAATDRHAPRTRTDTRQGACLQSWPFQGGRQSGT